MNAKNVLHYGTFLIERLVKSPNNIFLTTSQICRNIDTSKEMLSFYKR